MLDKEETACIFYDSCNMDKYEPRCIYKPYSCIIFHRRDMLQKIKENSIERKVKEDYLNLR